MTHPAGKLPLEGRQQKRWSEALAASSEPATISRLLRGRRKRGRPEWRHGQWSLHFLRIRIKMWMEQGNDWGWGRIDDVDDSWSFTWSSFPRPPHVRIKPSGWKHTCSLEEGVHVWMAIDWGLLVYLLAFYLSTIKEPLFPLPHNHHNHHHSWWSW